MIRALPLLLVLGTMSGRPLLAAADSIPAPSLFFVLYGVALVALVAGIAFGVHRAIALLADVEAASNPQSTPATDRRDTNGSGATHPV